MCEQNQIKQVDLQLFLPAKSGIRTLVVRKLVQAKNVIFVGFSGAVFILNNTTAQFTFCPSAGVIYTADVQHVLVFVHGLLSGSWVGFMCRL